MLNKKKYKYVQNRKLIHKKYIQIENKILQNRNNRNSMKYNYSLKYVILLLFLLFFVINSVLESIRDSD